MKVNLRDVTVKCKKLRRENLATGTLRQEKNIIPITVIGSELDKYVRDNGFHKIVNLELEGEIIKAKIIRTRKDLLIHNIINVDFIEVN